MSTVDNERPPYVMFEKKLVEDRAESVKQGHYVSKEIDWVKVTRPGSRDTYEAVAQDYVASLKQKARQQLIPFAWAQQIEAIYTEWQKGNTLPPSGTPIKGWPVIGPAAQDNLIRNGIMTVEDLAAIPDNELTKVGTGAVTFKQKAVAWLDAANQGKTTEELATLRARCAEQERQIAELAATVKSLIPPDTVQPAAAKKA